MVCNGEEEKFTVKPQYEMRKDFYRVLCRLKNMESYGDAADFLYESESIFAHTVPSIKGWWEM